MGLVKWAGVALLVLAVALAVLAGVLGYAEVSHGVDAMECCQRGG